MTRRKQKPGIVLRFPSVSLAPVVASEDAIEDAAERVLNDPQVASLMKAADAAVKAMAAAIRAASIRETRRLKGGA